MPQPCLCRLIMCAALAVLHAAPVVAARRCSLPGGGFIREISGDGRLVYLTYDLHGRIDIWDTQAKKLVRRIEHKDLRDDECTVSSQGGMFITALKGRKAALLVDLKTGKQTVIENPTGVNRRHSFAFSADERYIAVNTQGIVRIFECAIAKELNVIDFRSPDDKKMPSPSFRYLASGVMRFSPDSQYFFQWTGGGIASVKIGQKEEPTYFRNLVPVSIGLTPKDPHVIGWTVDGNINTWDYRTGKLVRALPFAKPRSYFNSDVSLCPDGRWLIVSEKDLDKGKPYSSLVDFANGKEIATFRSSNLAYFSPDSKLLYVLDFDKLTYEVREPARKEPLWNQMLPSTRFPAFSPDSQSVWVCNRPNVFTSAEVAQYDARTGKLKTKLKSPMLGSDFNVSDSHPHFVIDTEEYEKGRQPGKIEVINSNTGKLCGAIEFRFPRDQLSWQFSRDGKTLVVYGVVKADSGVTCEHIEVWDIPVNAK